MVAKKRWSVTRGNQFDERVTRIEAERRPPVKDDAARMKKRLLRFRLTMGN
jgi:hypothetical protein